MDWTPLGIFVHTHFYDVNSAPAYPNDYICLNWISDSFLHDVDSTLMDIYDH